MARGSRHPDPVHPRVDVARCHRRPVRKDRGRRKRVPYPLIFLPFISSAFVLTETMPGPVRAFAEHQPVTPIVNAIRDLYTRQPVNTDIWIAFAWCVGILVAAYALAMATYHRKHV